MNKEALNFRLESRRLEQCVRHIIHCDLKGNTGSQLRNATAARRLMLSSSQTVEPLHLGADGLGLDSLSTLSAAAAVSRFFDLGASGLDDYLLFDETVRDWGVRVEQHLNMLGKDAVFVFKTSGSLDRPNTVRKPMAELQREVAALSAILLPPGTRRIVALVPPQHIFGWLFTVLLPSKLNLPVYDATIRGTASVMGQIAPGDYIVGTPFNWTTLLSLGRDFPANTHGVTAAGAMSSNLRAQLGAAGLSSLCEVFGSTQTGGIGWRDNGEAPYTLFPHLERYGEQILHKSFDVILDLQDHMEWQDMRRFRPNGRIDRAVQVAGVNVSLSRVRDILCACELVADAAVRLAEDRLKAFVVPNIPAAPDRLLDELEAYARQHLEPAARPVTFTFGETLPRNEIGKLSDW